MLSTESYIVLQYNLSRRLARDQYGDLVSLDQAKADANEEMNLGEKKATHLENSFTEMSVCLHSDSVLLRRTEAQ